MRDAAVVTGDVGGPSPAPAWSIVRGAGPVVAAAIHQGHDLRPALAARIRLDPEVRLREEDPFTAEWTSAASTRVIVHRSRFEVDLNRTREGAVYLEPEHAWGLEVWSEPLPAAVAEESRRIHDAFYAAMTELCTDLERRHGGFVVLDVHSYNHRRGGPDAEPDDPAQSPEVNIGTGSMDRHRWGRLLDRFTADLRSAGGLDVQENVRFQGGYLARWVHEQFPETGCALALEFKKTFMDEWTGRPRPPDIARRVAALEATVPGLVRSLRERVAAPVRSRESA